MEANTKHVHYSKDDLGFFIESVALWTKISEDMTIMFQKKKKNQAQLFP